MLRKKESFTVVTPIPGFIPRQLALDILHSHSEVITLNPLVLDHRAIPAPRTAAADEYYSSWYEIVERIQYVPGVGRAGSGRIAFTGCFHDMPWGLQTHICAPLHTDLRSTYRVAGNQPGREPPAPREMGLEALGAPRDGLYLREDVEIRCNLAMLPFVRAQLKAASREMVRRIIKKAELLDAGVLLAMMEGGRLRTYNPNDRSRRIPGLDTPLSPGSPRLYPPSPGLSVTSPPLGSPRADAPPQPYRLSQGAYEQHAPPPKTQLEPAELPGDMYHAPPPPPPPPPSAQAHAPLSPARPASGGGAPPAPYAQHVSASSSERWSQGPLSPPPAPYGHRASASSSTLSERWSQGPLSPPLSGTQRTSYAASASPSPGIPRHSFASELAAHRGRG